MNKNTGTKSSCLFLKMKLVVKITRSSNCIESLKVYFGRLVFYRYRLKVITFQTRFFEKLKMQRLPLPFISNMHSNYPGIKILHFLPVSSKQTYRMSAWKVTHCILHLLGEDGCSPGSDSGVCGSGCTTNLGLCIYPSGHKWGYLSHELHKLSDAS